MRSIALRHPFWTFYVVAISFPSILFVYLTVAEGLSRMAGGPDGSLFMEFVRTRDALHQAHPILTQHQDGLPKVLTLYAMVPFAFPFLFFPFAPTVSALWILWFSRGREAATRLLSLYRPIHGSLGAAEGARIYTTLLAFIALGITAGIVYAAMFGESGDAARYAVALGVFDWRLFFSGWIVALFLNQGALLEELGWRGYALPLLVRHFKSPLRAAIVLGAAWAMWHSPRDVWMIATGQQTYGDLLEFLANFIPACIGMTIVATYFVNITGGSVLPAIMLHGTFNYLTQIYSTGNSGIRSSVHPAYSVTFVCAALAVVILVGTDLGWNRRKALHGGDGSTDPSRGWTD
jgi:hypothetical protein